jgi:hypothetical protein
MKLAAWADVLLQASAKRSRLFPVIETLTDTLNECRQSFGLSALINDILKSYGTLPVHSRRGGYGWYPQGGADLFPRVWWQHKRREWLREHRDRRRAIARKRET